MTSQSTKQLDYTMSTHAIEHLEPSKEAQDLCIKISEGSISPREALREIIKSYGIESRTVL